MGERNWDAWVDYGEELHSFASFAGAELWARNRIIRDLRSTGFNPMITIDHNDLTVAVMRADALGRIWTDLTDREVLPGLDSPPHARPAAVREARGG